MKVISLEELKKIQLEILQKVHDYCTCNNINYSLAYGTLIGAIRHHGYIPWDDDIDILMTRDNYNKFIEGFNKAYSELDLYCPEHNLDYYAPYANVIDNRTILKEENIYHREVAMGVKIDVFPLDASGKNKIFDGLKILLHYLWSSLSLKSHYTIHKTSIRKIKEFLIYILARTLGYRNIQRLIMRIGKTYKNCNSEIMECIVFTNKSYKFKKADFDNYLLVPFENRSFYIACGYDNILKTIYGDYNEFPPMEQRIPHHNFKAWWKDEYCNC